MNSVLGSSAYFASICPYFVSLCQMASPQRFAFFTYTKCHEKRTEEVCNERLDIFA